MIYSDQLPRNIEGEAALLGIVMSDSGRLERVMDHVSPSDFYEPVHGRIFDAILSLAAKGEHVSPVRVGPLLADDKALKELGGGGYLATLTGNPATMLMDAVQLAKSLADLSLRRRMIEGLHRAATMAMDPNNTNDSVVSTADAALSEAFKSGEGIEQATAGAALQSMLAAYDEPKNGVTCRQIPSIDEQLGPIRPKQLVILAARPGMGKTAVALSYGIGAARNGFNVLFVSLEMSGQQLMQRAVSDVLYDVNPIPYHVIRDGSFDSTDAKRKVWETARLFNDLPLEIVDAGALTVGRLNMLVQRHARRLEARAQKLDLVIIDYLQLLHPDRKGQSRYEQVTEVSMMCKAMAKVNNVGVLALAQLSREVEKRQDKKPILSDLRDSGQIEQDADSILFLYRDAYYLKQSLPDPTDVNFDSMNSALELVQNDLDIIVAKRRDGETGTVKAHFNGFYQAVRG